MSCDTLNLNSLNQHSPRPYERKDLGSPSPGLTRSVTLSLAIAPESTCTSGKRFAPLGAIAGDLRQEAEAFAHETMKRVAYNLDLLTFRFYARGWVVLTGMLRTSPNPDDGRICAEIERITKSPIPPSLSAFWRVVGGVDLVWDYKTEKRPPVFLPGITLDLDVLHPLYIAAAAARQVFVWRMEHAVMKTHPELLDPFSFDLAPDYLHKADISGGVPYAIKFALLRRRSYFSKRKTPTSIRGLP